MTRTLETINGHQYWVTRDDAGKIIGLEGADPAPAPPPPDPAIAEIQTLLAKASATFTTGDLADTLKKIAKKVYGL